jgi:predicted amidohydrolase
VRVAAVQLNSGADVAANRAAAERLTRAAAADGARLIVLPEKWTAIGSDEQLRAAAEPLEGPTLQWARSLARELRVELVAGSFCERVPGEEKLANTSLHVDPSGELRAVYRKIHMFDVEVGGQTYRESDVEEPGDEIVLSSTADGVELGLSICYDLRFPELYRILAVRGARILLVPAAFTLATTRDHWEALLRARAIENQAFVIAANQVGAHPGGHRSGGRSMIVDPWGVVLAQAADSEGYITAELDLARQQEIRAQLPSLANRRSAAYRWPEGARTHGGAESASAAGGADGEGADRDADGEDAGGVLDESAARVRPRARGGRARGARA